MFQELVAIPRVDKQALRFVDRLLQYQEPFIATAQSLPALTMSDEHLEHAQTILSLNPAFANFRFETCPRRVSDERFWSAYFTLLASEARFRATVRPSSSLRRSTSTDTDTVAACSAGLSSPEVRQSGGESRWSGHSPSPFPVEETYSSDGSRATTEPTPELRTGMGQVATSLRTTGAQLLSAVTTSITAFVEELDTAHEEMSQGGCADDDGELDCCQLPATFYVTETVSPLAVSPAKGPSPASMKTSPTASSPEVRSSSGSSADVDEIVPSRHSAALRLAPWWAHLRGEGELAAVESDEDAFEWYC